MGNDKVGYETKLREKEKRQRGTIFYSGNGLVVERANHSISFVARQPGTYYIPWDIVAEAIVDSYGGKPRLTKQSHHITRDGELPVGQTLDGSLKLSYDGHNLVCRVLQDSALNVVGQNVYAIVEGYERKQDNAKRIRRERKHLRVKQREALMQEHNELEERVEPEFALVIEDSDESSNA